MYDIKIVQTQKQISLLRFMEEHGIPETIQAFQHTQEIFDAGFNACLEALINSLK